MSRRERQKGARGERDLRDVFRAHGFDARRDGRLDADLVHDVPGIHVEAKRCETLLVPKWLRQVVADAGQLVPALFFRRSREPWWVIVPADHYLALQASARRQQRACSGTMHVFGPDADTCACGESNWDD